MGNLLKLGQALDVVLIRDRILDVLQDLVSVKHGQKDFERLVLDHIISNVKVFDARIDSQGGTDVLQTTWSDSVILKI